MTPVELDPNQIGHAVPVHVRQHSLIAGAPIGSGESRVPFLGGLETLTVRHRYIDASASQNATMSTSPSPLTSPTMICVSGVIGLVPHAPLNPWLCQIGLSNLLFPSTMRR